METMTLVFVFAYGAIIGSFLNVCIARLPDGRSIVRPPSHCPKCQSFLAWYDNVPILSYLVLGGRCRTCRVRISAIYPAVEVLTGALAVALFLRLGPTLAFAGYFAFAAALLVITFIDLDHQIIPDAISLPGIFVGFAAALLFGQPTWSESLAGILLGGGLLWGIAEGYARLTGREGMGGGDIKLLAMIGAFLGWKAIPVTLLIASLVGTAVGLALMLARGRDTKMAIPFGPFLAAGAVCALFWGDALIAWYLGVSGL